MQGVATASTVSIFIDESGNLGRSGSYFVVAALIPRNKVRLKNIATRMLASLREKSLAHDEIKASDLSFSQKQYLLRRIASQDDFSFVYIAVKKSKIRGLKLLADKNLCFNYLVKNLLEHIIVNIPDKSDTIHVILDNRNVKVTALNILQEYIRIIAYTEWDFEGTLDVSFKNSQDVKNLQIVDLIANTVYGSYEYRKHHLMDIVKPHLAAGIEFPFRDFHSE